MPLTIEVGLNQKTAKNFASEGISIAIRAELDQALLGKPQELQREIATLYSRAEESLRRRSQPEAIPATPQQNSDVAPPVERPSTASQMKALRSMCQRVGLDLDEISRKETGRSCDRLSIREASRLIDLLKTRQNGHAEPAGSRNGGSR